MKYLVRTIDEMLEFESNDAEPMEDETFTYFATNNGVDLAINRKAVAWMASGADDKAIQKALKIFSYPSVKEGVNKKNA